MYNEVDISHQWGKNKLFNNCWGNRLGACKKNNRIGSQPI